LVTIAGGMTATPSFSTVMRTTVANEAEACRRVCGERGPLKSAATAA
jgi:hypothetical protein